MGGTEVVKSFSSSTQGQNCHKAKLINLARALAWLIAKDALSLTVFKVGGFIEGNFVRS